MKFDIGHSLHGPLRHVSLFYWKGLYLSIMDDRDQIIKTWKLWPIKVKIRSRIQKNVMTGAFTLTTFTLRCWGGMVFAEQYADYPSVSRNGRTYPAHREWRRPFTWYTRRNT